MRFLRSAARAALALVAALTVTTALADKYPSKPVHVIVPFPAGGISDVLARTLGAELARRLGQSFVVENRPGAGGNIGNSLVARAPADGYTIAVTLDTSVTLNPLLYSKIGFDPMKELQQAAEISTMPMVLVVHPSVTATSLKELVALALRADPPMTFASGGPGSPSNIPNELLAQKTGIKINQIPYVGNPPQVMSVLSGQTQALFAATAGVVDLVREGKLRALAVVAKTRFPAFPDVPTMAEAGVSGIESENWQMLAVPAGTPRDVIDLLNREVRVVLQLPEVQAVIVKLGMTPLGEASPEQVRRRVEQEHAYWKAFAQKVELKLN